MKGEAMSQTPSTAITSVSECIGRAMIRRVSDLRNEADEIEEQWQGLLAAGGARDDHAAVLLAKLEPHLSDIASFAATCRTQILAMLDDPFGCEDANEKEEPCRL